MTVKEIAEITGISVRTLHHYDKIGLLHPKRQKENGYRLYSNKDLDTLQQILFFKACGFTLEQIKNILQNEQFDNLSAFEMHKKFLLQQKEQLEKMLHTLDKTIKAYKGEITMSQYEKFKGFNFDTNPFAQQAKKLWGDKMVNQTTDYLKNLNSSQKDQLAEQMTSLFIGLARVSDLKPDSKEAQDEIRKMYNLFNTQFGTHYSPQAFAGLGQVYITDERFTKKIDSYKPGLSSFLAQAMGIFAGNI